MVVITDSEHRTRRDRDSHENVDVQERQLGGTHTIRHTLTEGHTNLNVCNSRICTYAHAHTFPIGVLLSASSVLHVDEV